MIADTLRCSTQLAQPLTELVYQKTKGNPFFTNQFLKSLYDEGLISFDFQTGSWQCDLARVKMLALTEDVVEFMARQLQKLPIATQTVLKLAACIGNSFDLATLKIFEHLFTTKAVGKGTGLGLSIAHQIVVEKHQGVLEVNSILGKGSEFIITLPM